MSDELREILRTFFDDQFCACNNCKNDLGCDTCKKSDGIENQALSAIRKAIPRMVELDKEKVRESIISTEAHSDTRDWSKELLNRQDIKKERNNNLKRIEEVASALCEQVGEIVKVKE
jgi:hypothetical protein